MLEFFNVVTVQEALKKLDEHLRDFGPEIEEVNIMEAFDRVLAEDVTAQDDVPGFDKSTVDGYAIKAMDSYGASESMPAMFCFIGEVLMGEVPKRPLNLGEAMWVPTGGMLPKGADAVVMVEHTDLLDETTVNIYKPVSPFENIVRRGDDIKNGSVILTAGHRLRPQDIGALAGVGVTRVLTAKKPRVAIISTGDEIVSPETKLSLGCVRDINSYTLAALVKQFGGEPLPAGIIEDDFNSLKFALDRALTDADMVLISGGSSVGHRDVTAQVISAAGNPGVIVHGVSVKPGKPVVAGIVTNKPVLGLPGHPVSAIVIFYLVVRRLIEHKLGLRDRWAKASKYVEARIARNIASVAGREDYIRVALRQKDGILWAEPVLGKSALISTMVNADGMVRISPEKEGLLQGETVQVELF